MRFLRKGLFWCSKKYAGFYLLLDALEILSKKGYHFSCDIVGAESKEIDFAIIGLMINKRGLVDSVRYNGPIFGKDKEEAYDKAQVFLFPTYYESFGLVAVEAMQHHLPVVTTDVGGIPDMVLDGVTGYVVPPKNSVAFASALSKLLDSPDLIHSMGEAGYQHFKECFTQEIFEKNMCNILKECSITEVL